MNHQTTILLILFISFIIGCNDSEFETKVINIVSLEVPEIGTVNNPINMQIQAQANNGCYSNLNLTFKEINHSNYQIVATGSYDVKATACPEVIVSLDTIISFIPTQTGTYYITANQAPYTILRDTIKVN